MIQKIIAGVQRFPALIITLAVILAGVAGWFGADVTSHLTGGGFSAPESESTQVRHTIDEEFDSAQASMIVIIQSKNDMRATEGTVRDEVNRQASSMRTRTGVEDVKTYYSTGSDTLLSDDKMKSLMLVTLAGDEDEQAKYATAIREEMKSDSLSFQYGGTAAINGEITKQVAGDLVRAEVISFAILAVLLVLVFRGVVAALLPLILGGLAIIGAFAALKALTSVAPVVEYAMNVITLLGLGLAVDYSLLIISRFREELYAFQNDTQKALAKTYQTAGKTVFFSGLTVIVSLASLTVFPLDFLRSMGIGGVAAVGVALVVALLVLPAILRVLGPRINWLSFGSVKRMNQAAKNGEEIAAKKSVWYKTGAFFMSRPVTTIVVSLAVLALTMLPLLHVQLAAPNEKVLPESADGRQVTLALDNEFGMKTPALTILYSSDMLRSPEQIGRLYDYATALEKKEGVDTVNSVVTISDTLTKEMYQQFIMHPESAPSSIRSIIEERLKNETTRIDVSITADASSSEARQLVETVRSEATPGASIKVGGFTAEFVDQLHVLGKYLPYALLIIGVALFVLLFLMLGSLVIPIKAMLQNMLSLGAAFGGMVLLFGDGFGADLLHLNDTGVIYATLPAMIFAIAFGLSMDYSVFLYGRIKEQYDKTGDNDEAVLMGLQKTGGIITSAALLLFVVVIAFATSGIAIMQQIGVGLALAILLDAFIVRMVLVPATMRLLGKYNWWAPKPLKRFQERLGWGEKE